MPPRQKKSHSSSAANSSKQATHYVNMTSLAFWLKVLLVIAVGILISIFLGTPLLFRGPNQSMALKARAIDEPLGPVTTDCAGFTRFGFGPGQHQIVTFGELHGQNEVQLFECLDGLAKQGGRVLIETENTGESIDCATIHSAYAPLNDRVTCFGFDLPPSEARNRAIAYGDFADFLANKMDQFIARIQKLPKQQRVSQLANDLINFAKLYETTIQQQSIAQGSVSDKSLVKNAGVSWVKLLNEFAEQIRPLKTLDAVK